jgi:nucleotide-binding universal stress UspA family protein
MSQLAYLVPHDFTPVADIAVRHALQIARQTNGIVYLLHVTKADSEKAAANAKFAALIPKLGLSIGDPKVEPIVKTGSIFTDIGTVAKDKHCSLVIMGTHGAKGMQKVFGSFAIKVITSTDVPFVIVQDRTPTERIEKIVFPINLTRESLQVMNAAANLALDFNATIHLIAPKETDNALVGKILDYGKKIGTDLYAIAYFSDSLLPQFDTFAQNMITNEQQMPCLIINSKETGSTYF